MCLSSYILNHENGFIFSIISCNVYYCKLSKYSTITFLLHLLHITCVYPENLFQTVEKPNFSILMLIYETKVPFNAMYLRKVSFAIYQWKAYNLRILDIWLKLFFIFPEKCDNLGQF